LDEFESEVVARIHSQHLPPQIAVDDEGLTELASCELHRCDADGTPLLLLTGDHQSQTIEGHYRIVDEVLEVAVDRGVERAYALGGVATGEMIDEYSVVGASNDRDLLESLEAQGVRFGDGEPEGGIVGVSGLLLGLGGLRGLPAACLMGETSGYVVDPKSAHAVLDVLTEVLEFDVDTAELESKAEEMEEVVQKLEEMNQGAGRMQGFASDEDLRYIG
ncbi:MAG: proteasome assembly chaperone family protein, partial [Halobacteriota archaeon]